MSSPVSRIQAAESTLALQHFSTLLQFETDCWDVHFSLNNRKQDFVLLDVRSLECFMASHIHGAINLPYSKINEQTLSHYDDDTLFVVYCAGPHCNATEKAAIRLAKLGKPVKKMIGGITGWLDEGFVLEKGKEEST